MPDQFTHEGGIVGERIPCIKVPIGKWSYAERMEIPESGVVAAYGGDLVIQCPACQAFSEI